MKNLIKLQSLLLVILTTILLSCQKEIPIVTTKTVTDIATTTANSGGVITDEGSSVVLQRGVCWSTTETPTVESSRSSDGEGSGTFTSKITGLKEGTTYYVRAYATNSDGTGYGTALSFKTLGQAPTMTTNAATNINSTSATLNGVVNPNFLYTTVTFEYGTTTSYGQTVTVDYKPNNQNTSNTDFNVSYRISGLTLNTTYHYRVIGTNSLGTTKGNDMTFTTVLGIGDSYGGGIIFYIDNSGLHGFVAAETDQSTGIKWWNGKLVVTGAMGSELGTGLPNTNTIVAVQGVGNYAAKLCYDLVLNGYDDWFLPSNGELYLMVTNLKQIGVGNLIYAHYWSSTEAGNGTAWLGNPTDTDFKMKEFPIRAIRAF